MEYEKWAEISFSIIYSGLYYDYLFNSHILLIFRSVSIVSKLMSNSQRREKIWWVFMIVCDCN